MSVITTHALFAPKVQRKVEQWCCWFGRRRSIFGSAEIAANSCLTAMPLDGSERLLKIPAARGPSGISPAAQLKRE